MIFSRTALAATALAAVAWAHTAMAQPFTVAVIPDTQNYTDYKQQKAEGFPIESSELFLEQMRYIAGRARSRGGDIVFALNVGDMRQHFSVDMDADHKARGFKRIENEAASYYDRPVPQARTVELPLVVQGYKMLDGVVPFSVVPGNHDYDAMWTDARHPPDAKFGGFRGSGMIHFTGLEDFNSAFSPQSSFFKGKPWYIGASPEGGDSAQIFEAGGYRFLQIGLQFEPTDASLAWAQSVIDSHPGLPTIVSTHHFLAPNGKWGDRYFDDPERNYPPSIWDKFIRKNDQVFLVLSGHRTIQAFRQDPNAAGHRVYQILSDYQDRRQVLKDKAGDKGVGLGDGWMRLLQFDLDADKPSLRVRTYSTYYKAFSTDLPQYAEWYRPRERPTFLDEEFWAEDDFTIALDDFRQRFGAPSRRDGAR